MFTDVNGENHLLDVVMLFGTAFFTLVATMIWAVSVRPYLSKHGRKPSWLLFNWSPIIDYRKARKLAVQTGCKPRSLRLFEICASIGLILPVVWIVSWFWRFGLRS